MLSKTRTIIIATSIAAAAFATSATAASAALVVRSPATIASMPVVKQNIAAAPKEAGSAGVPGYTDQKCEFLLGEYGRHHEAAENYAKYGDTEAALATAEYAGTIKQEMEDNCVVVD
jgi:hypothetical protein